MIFCYNHRSVLHSIREASTCSRWEPLQRPTTRHLSLSHSHRERERQRQRQRDRETETERETEKDRKRHRDLKIHYSKWDVSIKPLPSELWEPIEEEAGRV